MTASTTTTTTTTNLYISLPACPYQVVLLLDVPLDMTGAAIGIGRNLIDLLEVTSRQHVLLLTTKQTGYDVNERGENLAEVLEIIEAYIFDMAGMLVNNTNYICLAPNAGFFLMIS